MSDRSTIPATTVRLDDKLAFRITELPYAAGIGRTKAFAEIKAGRLKSVMRGGRRLILRTDLEAYLKGEGEVA